METASIRLDTPGADRAELATRPGPDLPTSDQDRRRVASGMTQAGPRVEAVYALMAILLIGYAVSVIVRPTGDSWPAVDSWGVAVFELVGSVLCMARSLARSDLRPSARFVPLVLGAGLAAWSLGDFVVAISGSGSFAAPLGGDILYFCFYPLAYVGVMMLLRLQVRRFSPESWLDGIIAGLGAAGLSAAFLFHSVLHAAGGDRAVVATNLAFPIGDLLLLALVIGGTAVIPGRRRLPWMLVAVGFVLNTVGDTANLFASGVGASHFGVAANAIAWPTSILLVSASVWLRPRPSLPVTVEPKPSFLLPTLATGASLAMLLAGAIHPISTAALLLAVATMAAAVVRSALSVASLQRLTADRQRQAVTDQLTALPNRRALFELLDGLDRERRNVTGAHRQLAFLFVDLDRFKEVNDSFGHAVGDELLRQLGVRLRGALRSSDLLARLGGDEFVVTLLDADGEYGAMIAQRISARLHEPFQLGPVRARIGASIGIAVAPRDATEAADLLRCADLAMYRAKLEGKAFAIYHEELDGRGNRVGLVQDLRTAIAERDLELCYQPQINLETGEVVALEALLRWRHPRLGYIPPLEFLPLAEDAELIDPLTEIVLDMALEQCASWRAAGHEVAVCVNLSATNLLNPDLPKLVRSALARHELTPQALVLEITETTAITDFERSKQAIEQLRDIGLVVSVDDFGSGFTSLAYLSSLAVGELKLDRSFILGLATRTDSRNLALVRSTIDLAHALGLRVVAEGVEDEASFDMLVALGCDLAQGYLISKPKQPDEVELTSFPFSPAERRAGASL
jgi:diguanylate cyclase (GGDEF)-like protein